MFRRLQPVARKEEVVFPLDLKKLGLFINDDDQLRQIEEPDKAFDYHIHKVERVNERRREAVDECLRRVIWKRIEHCGLVSTPLPLGVDATRDRNVPVYLSNDIKDNTKGVLIIVPHTQDSLGIWSVREMESAGLDKGSMVSTIKLAQKAGFSVAILNCGGLIWSSEHQRAVTYTSWKALTEKAFDEVKNRIPGHETVIKHTQYFFDEVLKTKVPSQTPVYILSAGFGSHAVVNYMNTNYNLWKEQLQAIVMVESAHSSEDLKNKDFKEFVRLRCRSYIVHGDPRGSFVQDSRFGCATFSSEALYGECIVPQVQQLIFSYFHDVEVNPDTCNPVISTSLLEAMEGFVTNGEATEGDYVQYTTEGSDPSEWTTATANLKDDWEIAEPVPSANDEHEFPETNEHKST